MLITCLAAIQCVVHRNGEIDVDYSKKLENLALKGRLSNAATITKQINAIQEGIALRSTMKSWEVKARGVSKSILKQFEGLYCKRL